MPQYGQNKILYSFGSLIQLTLSFYETIAFAVFLIMYPVYFVAYVIPSKAFNKLCEVIDKFPVFGPLITWAIKSLITLIIVYALYIIVYTRLPGPLKIIAWELLTRLKNLYITIELKIFSLLGHELVHEITSPFVNALTSTWILFESWIAMFSVFGHAKKVLNVPDELYHGAVDIGAKFFDVIHGFNEKLEYIVPSFENMSLPSLPTFNMTIPTVLPPVLWNYSFPSLPEISIWDFYPKNPNNDTSTEL